MQPKIGAYLGHFLSAGSTDLQGEGRILELQGYRLEGGGWGIRFREGEARRAYFLHRDWRCPSSSIVYLGQPDMILRHVE